MRALWMLVRREFWEHRGLWITPLAIAVALIAGSVLAPLGALHIDLSSGVGIGMGAPPPDGVRPPPMLAISVLSLSVPFYIAAGILAVVYFLDCLYSERRDRSILFWRSLPVSDAATVLVKFAVGLILVPVICYLTAALTSLIVSAVLLARLSGVSILGSWDTGVWLHVQGIELYALLAALLWYAPYGAYLMLASAWARRSVYAWAFIPPVILAVLERMLFGTNFVGRIVQRGFEELMRLAFRINNQIELNIGEIIRRPPAGARGGLPPPDPSMLLASPQLWLGLIVAVLLLWMAIGLRRQRDEA